MHFDCCVGCSKEVIESWKFCLVLKVLRSLKFGLLSADDEQNKRDRAHSYSISPRQLHRLSAQFKRTEVIVAAADLFGVRTCYGLDHCWRLENCSGHCLLVRSGLSESAGVSSITSVNKLWMES